MHGDVITKSQGCWVSSHVHCFQVPVYEKDGTFTPSALQVSIYEDTSLEELMEALNKTEKGRSRGAPGAFGVGGSVLSGAASVLSSDSVPFSLSGLALPKVSHGCDSG